MPARARMLAGVLVRGGVAAPRGAAALARTEVHPSRADLHALFADPLLRMLDGLYRGDVRTRICSHVQTVLRILLAAPFFTKARRFTKGTMTTSTRIRVG